MNVTGGALIKRAFRLAGLLGVGQSLGGDYLADGLQELRLLVQHLRIAPAEAYTKTETVYQLAGASPVAVGPGATIDMPRPVRIERETFTRVGNVDHPLEVVDRARFARIRLKDTGTGWPVALWFDGSSPTGQLHLWPKSSAELHLVTIPALALFTDTTTEHDLPDGYEGYLGALLAERLVPLYEVALSDEVKRQIAEARRVIKRNNVSVPQLDVGALRADPQAAFLAGE